MSRKIYKVGKLTDSSKDAYAKAFLKIKEILNMDDEEFLKPFKVLDRIIELDREPTTKKIYVAGIIYALTHFYPNKIDDSIIDAYGEYVSKINKDLRSKIETNEITEKEKNKLIPWNDIIKLRDSMDFKKIKDYLDHFIISLYTFLPPRRVSDYSNMLYVDSRKDANNEYFNYVIHNSKGTTFIFNKHKTSKFYGQLKCKSPARLRLILNKYIRVCHIRPGENLIQTTGGQRKGLSENHLSNYIITMFKKRLGKPIGTSSLRHMYISHISKDPNLTLAERRQISKRMSHSLYEQLCYRKIGIK